MATVSTIDKDIQAQQQRQRELDALRAQVEQQLAEGEGDPAALAVQHVTIGAQIKAGIQRLTGLQDQRQEQARVDLLAQYAGYLQARNAADEAIEALDTEIEQHRAAIAELIERQQPLKTDRQTAGGHSLNARKRGLDMGISSADLDAVNRQFSR